MESVFFNSIGGAAARSSFPAKTPALLINCYLVFAVVRRTAKFEGRRNRGASAADNGNFDRLLFRQIISPHDRFLGAYLVERNIQYARDYVNPINRIRAHFSPNKMRPEVRSGCRGSAANVASHSSDSNRRPADYERCGRGLTGTPRATIPSSSSIGGVFDAMFA